MSQLEWEAVAEWWLDEVATDPVYSEQVLPLLDELMAPASGLAVDLGCGEGQAMRHLHGISVVGTDFVMELLHHAARAGPVVRAQLPAIRWLSTDAVDAAYAVFVLEHLPEVEQFFVEAARVVKGGGHLVVVGNHPAYTAPGAGPLVDRLDGETLWRWGPYFADSVGSEPAGEGSVTFYHRPLASLLNAAATASWALDRFVEAGLTPEAVSRLPSLAGQEMMPRLIGVRWIRL